MNNTIRRPGRRNRIKLTPVQGLLTALKYLSLIFLSLVTIIPMIVIFLGSFKTSYELLSTGPFELPKSFLNVSNYVRAFSEGGMAKGFFNTALILVVSLIATVMTGAMTSYILSRFDFKGRRLIEGLFLAASLIPSITTTASTYLIMKNLGLLDTRWVLIILYAGTDIITIYIFLQFLNGISTSIDEAAIVDGANYFQIFFKIILPLLKPAIATTVILKGVAFYNDFYTPYIFTMGNKDIAVISTALYKFQGPYGTEWEVICAGVVITMIPTLIIFLALQKWIYAGLTEGSVKE